MSSGRSRSRPGRSGRGPVPAAGPPAADTGASPSAAPAAMLAARRGLLVAPGAGERWRDLESRLAAGGAHLVLESDANAALDRLESAAPDFVVFGCECAACDDLLLLMRTTPRWQAVPILVLQRLQPTSLEQRILALNNVRTMPADEGEESLAGLILETLARLDLGEPERPFSLLALFELLAVQRRTCTVDVAAREGTGAAFLVEGRLVGAMADDLEGLHAVRAMLDWGRPTVQLRATCPLGVRTLDQDFLEVLRDFYRRSPHPAADALFDDEEPNSESDRRRNEEKTMIALESHLDEFKGVRGYIASGIMDYTGETLATHSVSPGVKLEAVGAVFNDIFRSAHEASKKIGLDACRNLVLTTPKGVIVMECSGADRTPHIHVIAILEEGGNQALAKMAISKIIPVVVSELS